MFGRIRRSVESSVESAQAGAADLESVRLALQAELAIDYFELHGIDAQKRLLDTNVAAYETALQLTINRHQQGVVSGVDVAEAETQLETTRAQSLDLGVARAQLEHAIAVLIGKPPGDFTIPPGPIGVLPPEIPSGIPSELLERRPDVAAAERRTAAANAQVGVATAGFFPRLLLAASGGYASSTLTQLFSLPNRFWSIGPSIVETVFAGGKRRAAREQAQENYEAAVALYREGVLTALQQVEDNLAALRILGLEAAQQAIAVANERIGIDLLTRRMTASVNLIKALGGDWRAADLPSPGAVLARQEPGPSSSDASARPVEARPQ